MTEVTRRAIVALAAADETATEEERDRIAFALAGRSRLYNIAETAKMLGVSRPTVSTMIQRGMLTRTAHGEISEQSIYRYLTGDKLDVLRRVS